MYSTNTMEIPFNHFSGLAACLPRCYVVMATQGKRNRTSPEGQQLIVPSKDNRNLQRKSSKQPDPTPGYP